MVDVRALQAGVLYCLTVFAAALVLGAVRTIWVAPLAGESISIALEAPIILAVAWYACDWAAEQTAVSHNLPDRLAMGAVALALMVCAEVSVAILTSATSLEDYFRGHAGSPLILGELVFAILPVLRRRSRPDASGKAGGRQSVEPAIKHLRLQP
jgi:hypothetical protein